MTYHLNPQQQAKVIVETEKFIKLAAQYFNKDFPFIPVLFDLKGQTVGMYKRTSQKQVIRYNPAIFAKYFDDNVQVTVPHEVAHYIVDAYYRSGLLNRLRNHRKSIRPHGAEWKALMKYFGADASRLANYSLEGIKRRRYRTVPYLCGCRTHALGIRRHNKVIKQQARYHCRRCGDGLTAI